MSPDTKCGFCGIYPKWLQNWATLRSFIGIYGVLGTVQSMAFIYIIVSLTTLEKRFKIPSRTTGIILSGNEISQILSVLLIYYGGSGHRPRWIALGVFCSALSCFVLALPHAIYGPGQDALALTSEYVNATRTTASSRGSVAKRMNDLPMCSSEEPSEVCDDGRLTDTSIVPRLLVFFSQFILGIGTMLYYGLGQTYMDDNTKKKNTPMLLGLTFALRTVGPAFGFILSYFCLNLYIDPRLHPIIDKKDPRWLGAWWLGWIILGIAMAVFAVLLGMFPQELKKSKKSRKKEKILSESEVPLKNELIKVVETENCQTSTMLEKPNIKDFAKAVKRILTNKLLMFNIYSGVFYILSSSPLMNYLAKYLEVQFQTSPGGGTIITGPLSLIGMVLGFLISGIVIGRFKPSPRPLLFWNVIVGLCFFIGQIAFMYLGCDTGSIEGVNFEAMQLNLTASCNNDCHCDGVKYSPVCHEATNTTFFSACHAGCRSRLNDTTFGDCSCVSGIISTKSLLHDSRDLQGASLRLEDVGGLNGIDPSLPLVDRVVAGPCKQNCFDPHMLFGLVSTVINILGCSGRIGNVLVNYRCVETRDKSLAQGVSLMLISLFGLIPGPIIFGAIMDSTCLVWDYSCKKKGNCWVYHRNNFRYYVNIVAAGLCLIGVILDGVVCYLSKGLDLYGDNDESNKSAKERCEISSENMTTTNNKQMS